MALNEQQKDMTRLIGFNENNWSIMKHLLPQIEGLAQNGIHCQADYILAMNVLNSVVAKLHQDIAEAEQLDEDLASKL
jgi:hypothetical protein